MTKISYYFNYLFCWVSNWFDFGIFKQNWLLELDFGHFFPFVLSFSQKKVIMEFKGSIIGNFDLLEEKKKLSFEEAKIENW